MVAFAKAWFQTYGTILQQLVDNCIRFQSASKKGGSWLVNSLGKGKLTKTKRVPNFALAFWVEFWVRQLGLGLKIDIETLIQHYFAICFLMLLSIFFCEFLAEKNSGEVGCKRDFL